MLLKMLNPNELFAVVNIRDTKLAEEAQEEARSDMGEGWGIFEGRVLRRAVGF